MEITGPEDRTSAEDQRRPEVLPWGTEGLVAFTETTITTVRRA